MVHQNHILIHTNRTIINLTNTDTANIFVIINGTDQNLKRCILISLRSRNVIDNSLKQRSHIPVFIAQFQNCITSLGRCIDKWAVQLLVRSVQINEQLQNLINNFFRASFRTVNLIDTYDNRKIQIQCFSQNELRLRHRTFKGIYHQNNAVYHLQYTFYFASEVSVSRGVYNIDLIVFIINCCVFR